MACPDENILAAYAENELGAERRSWVADHIDGCAPCRIVVSELARDPDATEMSEPIPGDHTAATSLVAARALKIVPGTLVGEYEVTGRLGSGGMGVVYAATHPRIGKRVAIKVLLHEHARDPQALARFENEARAVNAIGHPNIVDIFGFGELADRSPYCVMEFVAGESLQTYLEHHGALPLAQALPILRPIFDAVAAAHERNVIHRDLKPGNVMIGGTAQTIKILDFGLAKMLVDDDEHTELTAPGVAMGTPLFMSPEQYLGDKVDHRTDIYALGVMVYQMLSGTYPFAGSTPNTVRNGHFFDDPPALSSRASRLPLSIDAVIVRALAKDPAHRYQTVRELAAGLEACAADTAANGPIQIWPDQPSSAAMMSTLDHGAPATAGPRPGGPTPSQLEAPAFAPVAAPVPMAPSSAVAAVTAVAAVRPRKLRWSTAVLIAGGAALIAGSIVWFTRQDPESGLAARAAPEPAPGPAKPIVSPIVSPIVAEPTTSPMPTPPETVMRVEPPPAKIDAVEPRPAIERSPTVTGNPGSPTMTGNPTVNAKQTMKPSAKGSAKQTPKKTSPPKEMATPTKVKPDLKTDVKKPPPTDDDDDMLLDEGGVRRRP